MPRHKFVAFPQPAANGALLFCEYCGTRDNEDRRECDQETGNYLI